MNHAFHYLAPTSYEEALDLLAEYGDRGKLMAGGTDLLVNIRADLEHPTHVIDIKKIPGISDLAYDANEGLSIGAAVTINAMIDDPAVNEHYPLLAVCAHQLASHQVRNRATVVGNVVNASPCADMAPPLMCLEASVEIQSLDGPRTVPCHTFFTGPKKTILKPGEMVSRILVPARTAGARGGYKKLKRIAGHDLGIVGVAFMQHNDLIRVAVSSAAPTPVLVRDFTSSDPVERMVEETMKAIAPIDDVRCTKDYRLFMVGVYLKRLAQEVA
jgi:carbon-monoxide dehydrogenase medium subunit